jgi:phage terminase Nu1 subunit (DNA packaging protein)
MSQDLPETFTNVRGRIATISELSSMFGVAPETVRTWVGKGCPVLRKSDGRKGGAGWKFSTADVIEWRLAQVKRERPTEHVDIDEAKRRKLSAEAELAEMQAAEMAGTLERTAAVEERWVDAATRVRQRLLAIPHKLAPLVAVEVEIGACAGLIEAQVYEALSELSATPVQDDEAAGEGEPVAVPVVQAAAEDDHLPMVGRIPEIEQRSGL